MIAAAFRQLARLSVASGLLIATALAPAGSAIAASTTAKYCSASAANIVIYVDRTTNYDAKDKQDLLDGVSRIFGSLTGGERFSVRTIADSFTASQSVIDECVPVCVSKGFLGDLFSSDCTEGVAVNDKNHLRDRVVRQLETLLNSYSDLPYSEIVRTISLTATSEIKSGQPNRLFLFTDLLENSQYLPGKDFLAKPNAELLNQVIADHLVPDLGNAQVRVFGVGRSGLPGRPPLNQHLLSKITDFWTQYFTAAHATIQIQPELGGF